MELSGYVDLACSLVGIIIFFFVYKKPSYIIPIVICISVLANSIILRYAYTAVDEVLVAVAIFGYLLSSKRNIPLRISKSFATKMRWEIVFVGYLCANTAISLVNNRNHSSLRFLLIYIEIVAILLLLSNKYALEALRIQKVKTLFSIYLVAWITYYLWTGVVGVPWQYQQSVTWAGSSYAAFTAVIGGYLHLIDYSRRRTDRAKISFFIYFMGLVVTSQIYLSRIVSVSVLLLLSVFIIIGLLQKNVKNSVSNLITILLIFGFSFSASQEIIAVYNDRIISEKGSYALDSGTNTIALAKVELQALVESSALLSNPRESDRDRYLQLICARKMLLQAEHPQNILFGYGQNQHKTAIIPCPEIQPLLRSGQSILRPVGAASFLLDFGLVGLFLLLVVIGKSLLFMVKRYKILWLETVMYLQVICWSLITNLNDNLLLYMIILALSTISPTKLTSEFDENSKS